jgi:hypothetical protein
MKFGQQTGTDRYGCRTKRENPEKGVDGIRHSRYDKVAGRFPRSRKICGAFRIIVDGGNTMTYRIGRIFMIREKMDRLPAADIPPGFRPWIGSMEEAEAWEQMRRRLGHPVLEDRNRHFFDRNNQDND